MAFTAGQKLTAALLNAEFNRDRTVHATGDQSRTSSTVLLNSTNMVMSVEANASYIFDAFLIYTAGTGGDLRWNLALPAGTFFRKGHGGVGLGALANDGGSPIFSLVTDSGNGDAGGIDLANTIAARPSGLIIVGTTAGNAQMQFAQWTSNATATSLKAGSWMRLVKVTA